MTQTEKTNGSRSSDGAQTHWLYRTENLPKLWVVQIVILLLALLPEFFVHHHPHFGEQGYAFDATFGFFAWYGFLACAGMVAAAKVLGIFLKRKDTYYDE
jgi:fumarate reductase subunit D